MLTFKQLETNQWQFGKRETKGWVSLGNIKELEDGTLLVSFTPYFEFPSSVIDKLNQGLQKIRAGANDEFSIDGVAVYDDKRSI
jgi:hypothetical protein